MTTKHGGETMKIELKFVAGKRNDGMGAVTMADHVDGAYCFLCGVDIHGGERIYIDFASDQTMHYSHVGEHVNYGVWLGAGSDLVGAVIVDEGDYLGYFHPELRITTAWMRGWFLPTFTSSPRGIHNGLPSDSARVPNRWAYRMDHDMQILELDP